MQRHLVGSTLCVLCLLVGIETRDVSAAETDAAEAVDMPSDPRALLELGQRQLSQQQYAEAAASFARSLELIETASGSLSLELLEPLTGLTKVYAATLKPEGVASSAQRALNIVRRSAGINDQRQLPFLELLIDAQSTLARGEEALATLPYRERVSSAVYGAASIEHARELTRIGDWYCRLGDFFAARQRHRDAIDAIEAVAGVNSPALIGPLRAIARCCLTELATQGVESSPGVAQGFRGPVLRSARMNPDSTTFSRHVQGLLRFDGEQAIVRAAQVASIPDNAAAELQLEVLLQTADWFQLRDQPRTAADYYKRAYELSLTLPKDVYEQQHWLEPKPILYALPAIALRNLLQGKPPRERYVEVTFSVRADGKVRSPEVVTREDAGKNMVDETIASILTARYRPRLVDGKPTPAEAVRFRQQF